MKKSKFPLFLLIILLLNNGLGLINQDTERAEILKKMSQPISLNDVKSTESKKGSKPSETSKTDNLVDEMDYESIHVPTIEELKNSDTLDSSLVGGIITIPKIDISINIINGTNHENLKYGATTGLENQVMGKSNYVLFGHNMETPKVVFSDLKDLTKGDEIILTSKEGKEFIYHVSSSKVVEKSESQILNESEKPIVTLVNCSSVDKEGKKVSPNNTPYRLVVVGELAK